MKRRFLSVLLVTISVIFFDLAYYLHSMDYVTFVLRKVPASQDPSVFPPTTGANLSTMSVICRVTVEPPWYASLWSYFLTLGVIRIPFLSIHT